MAFLYVSDDMQWGQQNMKNKAGDIFFVGDGDSEDDDAVAYDLAILSSSDHTIKSRGTFSLWASMLSGGHYYTEQEGLVPPFELYTPP